MRIAPEESIVIGNEIYVDGKYATITVVSTMGCPYGAKNSLDCFSTNVLPRWGNRLAKEMILRINLLRAPSGQNVCSPGSHHYIAYHFALGYDNKYLSRDLSDR